MGVIVAVGVLVGVKLGTGVAVALGNGVLLGAGVNVTVGGGCVTLGACVSVAICTGAAEQPASKAASKNRPTHKGYLCIRITYGQGIGTASEKPCFSTVRISPFEG